LWRGQRSCDRSFIPSRSWGSRQNISPTFKARHPDVPWRAIAGIRDRIVHEYFRTNTRRIWDVVTDEIDALEKALGNSLNGAPAVD
jgi:uncharacterized protein with HEPN domain